MFSILSNKFKRINLLFTKIDEKRPGKDILNKDTAFFDQNYLCPKPRQREAPVQGANSDGRLVLLRELIRRTKSRNELIYMFLYINVTSECIFIGR